MTNNIKITGEVTQILDCFTAQDIKFNQVEVKVNRLSGVADYMIVVYKDIPNTVLKVGDIIFVDGDIRTRNVYDGIKNKLLVYIYGVPKIVEENTNQNEVELEAYICKDIVTRKSPYGRYIADGIIANNSLKGKSYYIPVIAFGKEASRFETLKVGDKINLKGRFQSRFYTKKMEDGTEKVRRVNELIIINFNTDTVSDSNKTEGSAE